MQDSATAEELIHPAFLLIPGIVFLIGSIVAFVGCAVTRTFWRNVLDVHLGCRVIFFLLIMGVLPLLGGAWADIGDVSSISDGKITLAQIIVLTAAAVTLSIYLYGLGCWFVREEAIALQRDDLRRQLAEQELQHDLTKADFNAQLAEVRCQRDYIVHLIAYFGECLGQYSTLVVEFLRRKDISPHKAIDAIRPRDQIRLVMKAVLSSYERLATVESGTTLTAVLFEENYETDGRFLVPRFSATRQSFDVYTDAQYKKHRHFFSLDGGDVSVATAAVHHQHVYVVDDAEAFHNMEHPFVFFSDDQRSTVKSMVAIPLFDAVRNVHWVLCIHSDQKNTFIKSHEWKAKEAQKHLQARLCVLQRHDELLEAVKLSSDAETSSGSLTSPVAVSETNRFPGDK